MQNQGNQAIPNIEITDYVKDYFTFEPGLNPAWSFDGTQARYNISTGLDPQKELIVPIHLRLNKSSKPSEIINTAEISKMTDASGLNLKDEDSTPDTIEDNDKGAFQIRKQITYWFQIQTMRMIMIVSLCPW